MDLYIGSVWDDTQWEVCDDKGFVFKRKRRNRLSSSAGHQPADVEAEYRRTQRAHKKQCLQNIRDKYRRELEQWEDISASLLRLSSPLPNATFNASSLAIASPGISHQYLRVADDLLFQLEAQEAFLRMIINLCDCVDAFYEAQKEQLMKSLLDLPIWGSPEALMRSLCD